MRKTMIEYLEVRKEIGKLSTEIDQLKRRLRASQERLPVLEGRLLASVQPVCGSATLPTIRTYTDGTYTTITVVWHGESHGGRIYMTQNEEDEKTCTRNEEKP